MHRRCSETVFLVNGEDAMELEHLFPHSPSFLILQLMAAGSLLIPAALGRAELYRMGIREMASNVVTFGPVALLGYVLYEVSKLS